MADTKSKELKVREKQEMTSPAEQTTPGLVFTKVEKATPDSFLNPDLQFPPRLSSDLTNDLKKLTGIETEKRRYARIQAQQAVSCTFYDSIKDDFVVLDAQVKNKSPGGLLLTTDLPLEIGMPVLVRLKHYSETEGNDELKDGIHAKVLRCDKIFVNEKESCYRIAIEYFELCQ